MSKWLICQVSKGMFSDERTVLVHTLHGNVSVFVPTEAIDEAKHRVRVRVLQDGAQTVAVMPDENQSIVSVNASELQPL